LKQMPAKIKLSQDFSFDLVWELSDSTSYEWVEVLLPAFLSSVLGGDKWWASHPGQFIPRERTTGTH
jgi:hypothetical protein